jgi:hypothetical protein
MSEVAEATETDAPEDTLAATFAEWNAKIEEAHNAPPVEEEQAENETEQTPSDDDSAEVIAGDAEQVTETPEPEVIPEGPSFLMKQEAARAGVDPKFIAVAKDDAQLEQMIVAVSRDADAKEEPLPEFNLAVELPEDEYPADDPVRKQLEKMASAITERQKLVERVLGGIAQVENERFDREQQQVHQQVFGAFDEYLDSYEVKELGKAGKLTPAQREERSTIANYYTALGATPDMPADEKKLLAELALTRHRRDLVEQRTKNKQAAQAQAKRVTGGKATTPIKGKSTLDQVFRDWNGGLRNGRLPLE